MSAKTRSYRSSTSRSRSRSPGTNTGYCMDITGRMHAVSTEDMTQILDDVKHDQAQNVVTDTLAALVTDVNATAEILRRSSQKRREPPEVVRKKKEPSLRSAPPPQTRPQPQPQPQPPVEPEVEYKLRISNLNQERPHSALPFPSAKRRTPVEERVSMDRVCQDFGIPTPTPEDNMKKRARSETPYSRKIIQIETAPPPPGTPICVGCNQEITGACVTALAPNSIRAQKFHPEHFVCTYCQKPLQVKGTYKEHQRKPYCHDCFYRLYSGHVYVIENAK